MCTKIHDNTDGSSRSLAATIANVLQKLDIVR